MTGPASITVSTSDAICAYSSGFAEFWGLTESYLAVGQTMGALLDRLREAGQLPPVVRYQEWQKKVLDAAKDGVEQEQWWTVAIDKIVHVEVALADHGNREFRFRDISDSLA